MAEAVSDSIVVDADVDEVMDVIADFESYPQWQPEMREVEVLETDDDGWGTLVRFVVDAKVLQATLLLAYTYTDTSMSWVLVEGTGVRRNDGVYELRDVGDGRTEVTYELVVEPAVPLPGLLKRQASRRIVESALKAMKQRVESRS